MGLLLTSTSAASKASSSSPVESHAPLTLVPDNLPAAAAPEIPGLKRIWLFTPSVHRPGSNSLLLCEADRVIGC